jgi:AcrR family transcriptional regulator
MTLVGPPPSRRAQLRRATVLAAAMAEAQARGWANLRRDTVAARAGIATGGVNNAFGSMEELKAAVMAEAISGEVLSIIAEGLAAGDAQARNAPRRLRQAAVGTLTD